MQEWFLPSSTEISQMFHLKDSFQYTHVKFVPLLWVTPTTGDQNLYKFESALCQEAFM
jgi:hypothetical protein